MGCHPSHWLSYFSRWLKPPTSTCLLFFPDPKRKSSPPWAVLLTLGRRGTWPPSIWRSWDTWRVSRIPSWDFNGFSMGFDWISLGFIYWALMAFDGIALWDSRFFNAVFMGKSSRALGVIFIRRPYGHGSPCTSGEHQNNYTKIDGFRWRSSPNGILYFYVENHMSFPWKPPVLRVFHCHVWLPDCNLVVIWHIDIEHTWKAHVFNR